MSKSSPLAVAASLESSMETEQPADSGFAARLRDTTKAVHREAERTGFIADLIRGRASVCGYALFLRNLVPVYAALEEAIGALADTSSLLSAFGQPGLRRLPSLLSDIEAIKPTCVQVRDLLVPEAQAYAQAISSAAEQEDDARLAAHAYARYLGDLSGGQILKPILARSLGLTADMLRFYEFPALAEPEVAKSEMRHALDRIPTKSRTADCFVDEAIAAFRHNIALSVGVARAATEL